MTKKNQAILTREEVAAQQTWDLTTMFATDAAWEAELRQVESLLPQAETFKGALAESAEQLLAAIEWKEALQQRLGVLYIYAHLKHDQDTTNNTYQKMEGQISAVYTQAMAAVTFYRTELLAIPEEQITLFLSQSPLLAHYQHYFEALFATRPYILSEKEEHLLASASEVFASAEKTFGVLNNADLRFPKMKDESGEEVELSHGRYGRFMESHTRSVRQAAFTAMYQTYGAFQNTFATTLSGRVKKGNFLAKVRGYDSARQAALFANSIPEEVYDTLVHTINDNISLLHRYVGVRKQALAVDEIRMYDMYVPMVAEIDLTFTYDEAKALILDGLAILGSEYIHVIERAFDERWIDYVENKGKRSGAYSSGTYGTAPYILMNWQDTLDNAFTLAHELGHSVHSYYTRTSQPFVYGSYSIFLAEVASTTNENLLIHALLERFEQPAIRAYIINHYLDGFKATVFRQTQFAEFEHFIYQADASGEALTADFLTQHYMELNKKYYGPEMVYDEEIGLEWSRIPHFYYNYYVYQYATGFSAASALSAKMLREGAPAVEQYIAFLKAGCSDYPIPVLQKAGVDMTRATVIKDALAVFEQRLTEFEALLSAK